MWKECALRRGLSLEEAVVRAACIAKLLEVMHVLSVKGEEGLAETMRIAVELKLTFYDAAYLYKARKHGLTLVTEDEELRGKAARIGVKSVTVADLT